MNVNISCISLKKKWWKASLPMPSMCHSPSSTACSWLPANKITWTSSCWASSVSNRMASASTSARESVMMTIVCKLLPVGLFAEKEDYFVYEHRCLKPMRWNKILGCRALLCQMWICRIGDCLCQWLRGHVLPTQVQGSSWARFYDQVPHLLIRINLNLNMY